MKDLSLLLLKNSFGAKMKNGFSNFCNGESSTSTLDHQKLNPGGSSSTCTAPPPSPPLVNHNNHPTLEEMILRLEMEEKRARKEKLDRVPHRMSCVNSSDILRSARNALNQYPRFSLDGKDAMYRSSFKNYAEKPQRLPCEIGGESVIWCKPGVVAKLMGLEAMPVPLNSNFYRRERLSAIIKRQNQRHEMQRRRAVGSCSRAGYCVMKPVELDIPSGEAGWPAGRFM
ncbi:hypothetical protein CDL12_03507 [Handroanthus impetiginosus]|uniref:DUF3741 domain-containing protein n=1 Tax=Handroanthus impetiginosus TaxID=429701 RepID=A0A2G9I1X7_9LAMI|nr:hypothetical protein CDL12_03507 [Handroanthus impetiginosus]